MPSGWPKEYYMVIFSSQRTDSDQSHYAVMSERMIELAHQQPGFLGVESVREDGGLGITISYWRDRDSIEAWRQNTEHQHAQSLGRQDFYSWFQTRIGMVTEERAFGRDDI